MNDIYNTITNQIIDIIEAGDAKTFTLPWHSTSLKLAENISTGKRYTGINAFVLMLAGSTNNYSSNQWGTYKQWHAIGGQVKRGATGTKIIFYKKNEKQSADDDKPAYYMVVRSFTVFNANQVEGVEHDEPIQLDENNNVNPLAALDSFVKATGASIKHAGDRAFYSMGDDYISMPEQTRFFQDEQFDATASYYSTLLHELTHWTGHKSRLERNMSQTKEEYAFEELIAEIGATFLCADFGIQTSIRDDHAGYIAAWLKILKNDNRAIFKAATHAQKAVSYLHSLTQTEQQVA